MSTVQTTHSRVVSGCWLQVPKADQVVGCDREGEHPLDARQASMTKLPQSAHGLQPAEDLFHALSLLLADQIARVARRALIDRAASMLVILGDVRGDVQGAHVLDEVSGVIVLIAAQRHASVV